MFRVLILSCIILILALHLIDIAYIYAQVAPLDPGETADDIYDPAAPPDPLGPPPANLVTLQNLLQRLINISVGLAFIALVAVLFYAGIRFLTSGGESKVLASAGNAVTWALLGILFLALAWLILKLIETFTGVPITNFCIGFPGGGTGC